MATYVENLIVVREQIAANLVTMTATPKPSYALDGESYSWGELFELYTRQLTKIDELIALANGAYEVKSRRYA